MGTPLISHINVSVFTMDDTTQAHGNGEKMTLMMS